MRGPVSMRVRQLDVQAESKTRDNVFVNVVVSVQACLLSSTTVLVSTGRPSTAPLPHETHALELLLRSQLSSDTVILWTAWQGPVPLGSWAHSGWVVPAACL